MVQSSPRNTEGFKPSASHQVTLLDGSCDQHLDWSNPTAGVFVETQPVSFLETCMGLFGKQFYFNLYI